MKINKDKICDILWGEDVDWEEVERTHIGERRWVQEFRVILKNIPSNKLYSICIDVPSTEIQDDSDAPFGFWKNEIELQEVEAVEKTIIVYQPKLDKKTAKT